METLLITFIIIITIAAILLLKLTEKIYHQKGQTDLLNEIYLNGDIDNKKYSEWRSKLNQKNYFKI